MHQYASEHSLLKRHCRIAHIVTYLATICVVCYFSVRMHNLSKKKKKKKRVSELHLKIPKTSESSDLFRLKGTALLDCVAKLISDHSEPAPRMALHENPLVLVKWSMKGNLVLKCAKPMDDVIKDSIKDALTYFFPSPSAEILVLNKPPTTALKILAVPRHNLDGTDTDDMDLLNDLTAHPAWADVELWSNPKFINLRAGMAGAMVVVSIVDDNQGNVGR